MNTHINPAAHLCEVVRPTLTSLEDIMLYYLGKRAELGFYPSKKIVSSDLGVGYKKDIQKYIQETIKQREFDSSVHETVRGIQEPNPPMVVLEEDIDYSAEIIQAFEALLPRVCKKKVIASEAKRRTADLNFLEALTRRVQYGRDVAESKFLEETEKYMARAKENDRLGIQRLLFHGPTEDKIHERVGIKGPQYGIRARVAQDFFIGVVIPITSKLEIDYFLLRAEYEMLANIT
jgi:chorismate mutase